VYLSANHSAETEELKAALSRIFDSTLVDCQFRCSNLRGCEFTQCDFTGAAIDGVPVEEALALYRKENG